MRSRPPPPPPPPLLLLLLLLVALVLTACRDALAAPDITMSIHGGVATDEGRGPPSFTVNQVHTLLTSIEFRLRDLSNTFRREQQTEMINSRIDMIFNKIGHLEVSNGMWFDKCQQSVMEECGSNHMTRRLDKAQQQMEITLEHIETILQTMQNHQKELEKDVKKVADRQTELSADIQSVRKDMSTEFDKYNSSLYAFKKQIQETVANHSQQVKIADKSLSSCPCSQNDDPFQMPDTTTTNKLVSSVNNMHNELIERSDVMNVMLKELVEITDKYRRKLDSDRHDVINEVLDSFWDVAIGEISTIQKKSGNELETKIKHHLQLLVDRQNVFMDNCHRLQSNERQIEDDMVFILGRILEHVDNKSISDDSKLEQISKMLKTQSSQDEKMFTELSELGKMQSDQVARTVAYSTNQVMKLHQDILNISNALMAVNNGSDCGCSTTTTTDVNGGLRRSLNTVGSGDSTVDSSSSSSSSSSSNSSSNSSNSSNSSLPGPLSKNGSTAERSERRQQSPVNVRGKPTADQVNGTANSTRDNDHDDTGDNP